MAGRSLGEGIACGLNATAANRERSISATQSVVPINDRLFGVFQLLKQTGEYSCIVVDRRLSRCWITPHVSSLFWDHYDSLDDTDEDLERSSAAC